MTISTLFSNTGNSMKIKINDQYSSRIGRFLGFMGILFIMTQSGISANSVLNLEVGKGQALQLEQNVSELFVANPEIADVQLNTPSIAYIFGKKPGSTSVLPQMPVVKRLSRWMSGSRMDFQNFSKRSKQVFLMKM